MPTPTLEELARRVEVLERTAVRHPDPDADPPGTTGDPQPNDPESIAAWIAAYQALPSANLTDEEYAELKAIFAEQRANGLATVNARIDALQKRFE